MIVKYFTLQARHFQRHIKSNLSTCKDCLSVSLANIIKLTGSFPEASLKLIKRCIDENLGCEGGKNKRMLTGRNVQGKKEQINCVHVNINLLGEEMIRIYKG